MQTKYLRILLTNRCNLNCYYCHREGEISGQSTLSVKEIEEYCRGFYTLGYRKFKLMGGEPTLRGDLAGIIAAISAIAPDIRLSMITNGIFDTQQIPIWKEAGLNYVNVSLHGWMEDAYKKNTGGGPCSLDRTKDNILALQAHQLLSKINFLLVKHELECELPEVIDWCGEHRMKIDLLNLLYSIDEEERWKDKVYSFEEIIELVERTHRIRSISTHQPIIGLPSTYLHMENGALINLKTSRLKEVAPFQSCATCKGKSVCTEGIFATRLSTEGLIRPCLFRTDNAFDLRNAVGDKGLGQAFAEVSRYLENL